MLNRIRLIWLFQYIFVSLHHKYMKHKGSRCDFTKERDADILRAYKEIISVRDNIGLLEIERRLLQSPSKRFWVSVDRAYNVILNMLNGKSISNMNSQKRAMFQEIFRRYKIYSKEHPSLTKMDVIWRVCNQEAPSFYLTPKSLHVILHRVRKEEKKRCYELRQRKLHFIQGTL